MAEADVDARIAALYGVPLDGFVAERDALARELRAAGDRDAGGAVKKLRKPSRVAWAINQAVRNAPDLLDDVLASGRALRDAQQHALSQGAGADLRAAIQTRQRTVDALTTVAVEALGASGAALREPIERTLQAASIDDAAAREVADGRLVAELDPPDIFATLDPAPATLTLVPALDDTELTSAREDAAAAADAYERARTRAATLDRDARTAADAAGAARREEQLAADRARAAADRVQEMEKAARRR